MKGFKFFRKRFIAVALSAVYAFSFSFPQQIMAADDPETVADAVSPVIDSVEVSTSGETLTEGDSILVTVSAFGQQSPIVSVDLRMEWENDLDSNWTTIPVTLEPAGDNLYTYERIIGSVGAGTLYVAEIKATDEAGNVTYADVMDGENYKYSYRTEDSLSNGASLTFAGNNGTFQYSDLIQSVEQMGFSVLTEDYFSDYIDMTLEFETEDRHMVRFYFYQNENNGNLFDQLYDYDLGGFVAPGQYDYVLTRAYVYVDMGVLELNIPDKDQYRFSMNVSYSDLGFTDEPEISKVEFSPNGALLAAGDEVQIRASINGISDPGKTSVRANLNASSLIPDNTIQLDLVYDDNTDTYCGTWKIANAVYPCEWYLDSFYIDTGKTQRYVHNFDNSQYVNVNNDPGFVDEKRDLNIYFYSLGESGTLYEEKYTFGDVSRRFTLQDLKMSLPEVPSFQGIQQTGWSTEDGTPVDEETKLLNRDGSLVLYAVYQKPVIPVLFQYVDSFGDLRIDRETFIFENGATKEELESKINSYPLPYELPDYEFEGWHIQYFESMPDVLSNVCDQTTSVVAEYKDAVVLRLSEEYVKQYSEGVTENAYDSTAYIVKKGTTVHDLKEQVSNRHAEEMDPKMEFSGWKFGFQEGTDSRILENGETVWMTAEYNKYYVQCILYDGMYTTIYTADNYLEKGEQFDLPEAIEGILSLKWTGNPYGEKTSFVIGDDIQNYFTRFTGFGTKAPEKPDKETVDAAVSEINNAEDGTEVIVEMDNSTVLPKEILTAAKDKNVNVVLDMKDYSWTINGQNVSSDTLEDIDLGVETNARVIPDEIVQSVAENNMTRQLSLSHDGEFGFDAVLTVNVGTENAGKFSNLYYYTSDQELDFIGSYEIKENGATSLQFNHASDYLIVISETPVTVEPTPDPEPSVEPTPDPEPSVEPTPDPEPSVEPTSDPEPSVEPTPDPEPSVEPTPDPEPSVEPTPAPSAEPDPQPSVEPAPTPEPTPEPVPTIVFEDVAESSPYYDAIYWAAANGITTGKTATTFQPDGGCTRAQFVTFLWRMRGQPEPQATAGFTDMVSSTSPFYKAISWAVEQGITTGYKDNTFRPNETCSRGAAVTFLYRAAGKPAVGNISTSFTDMVGRDHAYYDGIAWAIANNVTAGYKDNTFKPFRTCSRGQNVTFLYRARNILL